jgi:hypothetical protein
MTYRKPTNISWKQEKETDVEVGKMEGWYFIRYQEGTKHLS